MRYNPRSGLSIKPVTVTQKAPDRNGLVQFSLKTDIADTAPINPATMRFYVIDQLHRPDFGSTAERTGRESIRKEPQNIGIFGNASTHSRHHMNHMRIILDLAQELDLYLTSPAAQIITCQVDQHDMFGIFFLIFQ